MQNDYIMRIIEQFVQAIVAIIQRRKTGKYKESYELIKKASRYYLGIDLDTLLCLTGQEICDYFRDSENNLNTEKCVLCADLLYELALILEAQQEKEACTNLKMICLYLYTISIPSEPQFQLFQYFEKISLLTEELKHLSLPVYELTNLQSYEEFKANNRL